MARERYQQKKTTRDLLRKPERPKNDVNKQKTKPAPDRVRLEPRLTQPVHKFKCTKWIEKLSATQSQASSRPGKTAVATARNRITEQMETGRSLGSITTSYSFTTPSMIVICRIRPCAYLRI